MKRNVWLGLLVLACTVGVGACGDDDDSNDDSEGGSGGTGRAGTGTALSGRGGSGGIGTGASGSGSGSGGAGGASPNNPAGCPATAPAQDGACTMEGLSCSYGTTECDCDPVQGDDTMTAWDCNTTTGGMMMQMCPATEPTNGGTCTPGRGDCEFGARICDCLRDGETWACWDPADCPAMPPADGSTCPLVGMECEYDNGGGGPRGGGGCDCEDTGWDCGGDFGGQEDGGV